MQRFHRPIRLLREAFQVPFTQIAPLLITYSMLSEAESIITVLSIVVT